MDSETGHFADFEQFKIDSHFAHFVFTAYLFLLICLTDFGQVSCFTSLGKTLDCKKTVPTLSV